MAAANYGVFKVLYLGAGTAATPDQLGMEGVLRSLPPDALSRGQRTLLNIGAEIVVSAWSDGVVLQNWPLESVRVLATAGRMLYFLDTKQDVHFFLAQNQPAAEGIASSVVQARRDARQAHQQGKPVPAGSGTKVDKTKKQKTTPTNQQTTSSNDNLEFDHGFLFEGTRPEQLAQKSRFSRSEIARLNRYFLERCPDGKANPIEFAQMYASLHKSNINDVQEYTDLVFRTFDKDHDGCISFMEYIAFLGLTARGTPREKFELIFDTHDINHDAQLSREEVENMAASIFNLSKVNGYSGPPPPLASGELAELLFSSFDLTQAGYIEKADFVETCLGDEMLASLVDLSLRNRRGSKWARDLPLANEVAAPPMWDETGPPTPTVNTGNPQAEILAAELQANQSTPQSKREQQWHDQQEDIAASAAATRQRLALEAERQRLEEEEELLRQAAERQRRILEEQRELARQQAEEDEALRQRQRELELRRRASVQQAARLAAVGATPSPQPLFDQPMAQQPLDFSSSEPMQTYDIPAEVPEPRSTQRAPQSHQDPQDVALSPSLRMVNPRSPKPVKGPDRAAPLASSFLLTNAAKQRASAAAPVSQANESLQIDPQCSFLGNCRCLDCLQERGELRSM
eukprot:m.28343 g.28343  ORF g.28343 m.28343 type:complete len:631 (+) comp8801_c0_seq2:373-2265(+)